MPICSNSEDDYLLLSGVQHFAFCPRQWALIHVEQEWCDNGKTVEGELIHERCHDDGIREKRNALIVVRGLKVISHRLKLVGTCDVVEFREDANGIPLYGESGLFQPMPVEYKRGKSKPGDEDRAQVCAQAMALEEMFCCDIQSGDIFYNEIKHRETVVFDEALRTYVEECTRRMTDLMMRGVTPHPKKTGKCRSCSMKDICEPSLETRADASSFINRYLDEVLHEAAS